MPATFTKMSKRSACRPKRSAIASTRRAESVTSNGHTSAEPPASVMVAAVASAPGTSMSATTTWTPAAARAVQVARPRPLAPPVTKATRSFSAGTHPPDVVLRAVSGAEASPYRLPAAGQQRGTLCSPRGRRPLPTERFDVRILLWNVHGGYSDSLTSGGHTYLYLPPDDRGNGGLPRLHAPAGVDVRLVTAEELRDDPPDVVVLQRLQGLDLCTAARLRPGRAPPPGLPPPNTPPAHAPRTPH